MIITFCGHSSLYGCGELSEKIEKTIIQNIDKEKTTVFYCGGYGDFDNLCAKICRTVKAKQIDCEVVFVTPYITQSQQNKMKDMIGFGEYDSILYPPLENIPNRYAITKRNEWMINESDLVIAYVEHRFGGAYKTLEYARRKKKRIINLAE